MAKIPSKVRAGLTTKILYTSPSGEPVFLLANSSGNVISLEGVIQDAGTYLITFLHTDIYAPGIYKYIVYTESETERIQIDQGIFEMLPNLSSGDVRTQNQIILDAINAMIAGIATKAQKSVTVGDKSISYLTLQELLTAKDYFEELVAQEDDKHRQTYYAEFKRYR
jgi:hypothetical protein